jgi:hypothetical protein
MKPIGHMDLIERVNSYSLLIKIFWEQTWSSHAACLTIIRKQLILGLDNEILSRIDLHCPTQSEKGNILLSVARVAVWIRYP